MKHLHLTRVLAFALALVLLLGCTACGKKTTDDTGDTVGQKDTQTTVELDGKFTLNYSASAGMNPYKTQNSDNLAVCGLVYETLTELTDAFEAGPGLFTEWSSDDGETWTFTVAAGRTFHDGRALTAQDAAYSIQTAMASDLYSGRLSAVKDVKDSDDGTVTVTLARANTQFPALLNIPVIENNAADSTYPSGTGLYQFASDHQSLTVYSGHPDADKAPVDTVYLMECKSVEEIVSAFDNGQLDLALSDPSSGTDLSFSSLNDQRQYATTNLQYVGFNTNSSFFMTARYRQPFNYVIDRAFAVALLHDCAVATALPVHPASTLYDNALNESLSYDLDKAKKMFDDLKIVDYDGDGEREYMPDGQSPLDISLSLIVYADSTAKVSMANKIAADLTSIGIPVKVRELSWDNYQDALKGGKFDMYYGEVALPADFDLSALLKAGGSLNYGGITTGTYADVINAYLDAADSDRAAACSTMLQTISDNAPIVPVCFEKHCLYVHRGAVGGFSPTKYNIFHNITDWKINNA